jgi:hypothetical protein
MKISDVPSSGVVGVNELAPIVGDEDNQDCLART